MTTSTDAISQTRLIFSLAGTFTRCRTCLFLLLWLTSSLFVNAWAQCTLTLTPANLNPPSCGANDGSFSVQVTGIEAPYQVTLLKEVNGSFVQQETATLIAGTPTFVFLTGGKYRVDVAKGGTCSGSVIVDLPQQELTMTPVNLNPPSCGANDGSFSVQVTGIKAPYQVTLLKEVNGSFVQQETATLIAGTPTFVFLTGGKYRVDVAKGGTCSGSVIVDLPQQELTMTPANLNPPSCGANDGSFSVQVTGIKAPYQITLLKEVNGSFVQQETATLIAGTPTFVFLTGGKYRVDVAKGGTCSGSVIVDLPQDQLTMTPANLNPPSCGANDGSFQVQVTGIVPPYQFTLLKEVNGSFVQQENGTQIAGSPIFVGLTGGKYRVDVAKGGICSGSVIVDLPQDQLTLTPTNINPSCGSNSGSFQVQVTGIVPPYQFTLLKDINGSFVQQENGTQIAGSPIFVGLTDGTYQLAISKGGTCSGSVNVTLTSASVGGTVAGSTTVTAGNNTTTLTLSGQRGNVLKWQSSTSSNFSSPIDISNTTTSLTVIDLTQTTYYRAVVKNGNCPEAFSSQATITADPIVGGNCTTAGEQCSGNPFELARFSLSLPSAGAFPLFLTYRAHEGNATGRIRINGGSWQTFSLVQSANFQTVGIGSYAFVAGQNTIELASGGGYVCFRQLCTDGSSNACDFSILGSPSALTAAPGGSVPLNVGCTGGGCGGVSYTWSGPGASCTSAACSVTAPSTPGDYIYTVTANKAGCGAKSAQVTLTVREQAPPGRCIALGDQCSGNSQEIRSYQLTVRGGNFPLTLTYRSHEGTTLGRIRINGGDWQIFSLPQTPGNLSYGRIAIGNYTLAEGTNTIELASGGRFICFRELCVDVPFNEPDCDYKVFSSPTIISVAPGGVVRLSAGCSGSGCPGVVYQWSGNGVNCVGAECTVQAPSTPGNYTYDLTATKEGCGMQTARLTVRVDESVSPGLCLPLGDQCSGNSQEIRSYSFAQTVGGSFPLTLTYRSHEKATQGRIRINGGSWQSFSLPQTPGDLSYATVNIGTYALVGGNNTIELASGSGYICFRDLCLEASGPSSRQGLAEALTELPVELAVEVYPNPASGVVTLRIRTAVSGPGIVELLDLTGRVLQSESVELKAGDNELKSDVGRYSSGLYLLRARDAAGRQGATRLGRQ